MLTGKHFIGYTSYQLYQIVTQTLHMLQAVDLKQAVIHATGSSTL